MLHGSQRKGKCKHNFFDFIGRLGTVGMQDQVPFPAVVIKQLCKMNLGAYLQKTLL